MKVLFAVLVLVLCLPVSGESTFERQINSCEKNNAFACIRVGDLHYTGRGFEKDISTAEMYYEKGAAIMKAACDKGNAVSCVYYAGMLQIGKGVEQDIEKAYEMYHDLCEKAECESCGRLYYLSSIDEIPSDSYLLICEEPVYRY